MDRRLMWCLVSALVLLCSNLPAAVTWTVVDEGDMGERNSGMAAYDYSRHKVYAYGGWLGSCDSTGVGFNDTWQYDCLTNRWHRLNATSSPSTRNQSLLFYDSYRDRIILFAGYTQCGGNGKTNETWAYDPTTNSWANLSPSSLPGARGETEGVYVPSVNKFLIYGGNQCNPCCGCEMTDCWVYNSASNSWSSSSTGGGLTWIRAAYMTYDSSRDKAYLYSGFCYDCNMPSGCGMPRRMWSWTPSSATWATVSSTGPSCGGAWDTITMDTARDRVLVFCGDSTSLTWEWAPGTDTWTPYPTAAHTPTYRSQALMYFDRDRQKPVWMRGDGGAEIYEWNGASAAWNDLTRQDIPTRRTLGAAAYDSSRGQIVVYGGRQQWDTATPANDVCLNDTWLYDSTAQTWSKQIVSASPGLRCGAAMAYDAARGQTVLFGGTNGTTYYSDTWIWNGTTWQQASPGIYPSGRAMAAMTYDAARDRIVLFGGADGSGLKGDTWLWDGSNWTPVSPVTSPSPRKLHAMTYDANRQMVVLFGGYTGSANNQTYDWDGSNWSLRSLTGNASVRYGHSLAYDRNRGRVVLFGGQTADAVNFLEDTYEWDGSSAGWQSVSTGTVHPYLRTQGMMVCDENRNQILYDGGAERQIEQEMRDIFVFADSAPATRLSYWQLPPGDISAVSFANTKMTLDFNGGDNGYTPVTVKYTATAPVGLPTAAATGLWQVITSRTGIGQSELVITYGDTDIAGLDESQLEVYTSAAPNGPWQALASTVDMDNNRVHAVADHFSYFAIGLLQPTPTPTDTATSTPTDTPTAPPSSTPTATPSDTPTSTPTDTPSDTPTDTPTKSPTGTPSDTPTDTPSHTPSFTPSPLSTDTPTTAPTATFTKTRNALGLPGQDWKLLP